MSVGSLRSFVLPDSTSSPPFQHTINMGKNLFEVNLKATDPFTEFLMESDTLPTIVSPDVTSSSPVVLKESTNNEEEEQLTLLPPSNSFMLTDLSSSAPTLILNQEEAPTTEEEPPLVPHNVSVPFGEIYTLTLGDGTAVQLRVQTCDDEQQQQPVTLPEISSTSSELRQDESSIQPNTTTTTTLDSLDWNPGTLDELPQFEFSEAFQNLFPRSGDKQSLEQSNDGDSLSRASCNSDDDESLSSEKLFNSNMRKYAKMDLELFKNEFNTLPDGQLNLEVLLKNADVDISVDEIVRPTLTSLKKLMMQKKYSDWQVGLCLKIRRRKKNTAAVRSSRRKRVQYMSQLKHHVSQLSKRRKEAELENSLLKQLKFLWERLVQEVEAEVSEGMVERSNSEEDNNSNSSTEPLS